MDVNPYSSPEAIAPAVADEPLLRASVPTGGHLRRVGRGLKYLILSTFVAGLGVVAQLCLLLAVDPDLVGALVGLSLGVPILSAMLSFYGLTLCLFAPRETGATLLVSVTIFGQLVSLLFALATSMWQTAPRPSIIILVLTVSFLSGACFLLFLHRLAKALGDPDLPGDVVRLTIWLCAWTMMWWLLFLSPAVALFFLVLTGLWIIGRYLMLLFELASLAEEQGRMRDASAPSPL